MRNLNFLFSNSVQGESDLTRYCPRDAFEMPLTCPRHLFHKILILSMLLMVIGVGNVWGADPTWTWTASSASDFGTKTSGTVTLNGKTWSVERSSATNQSGLQSGCVQLGANGSPQTITLTTSAFSSYTITKVEVECSSYKSHHSVAISVGGTSYLSATATDSWTTVGKKYGTGSSTGNIEIAFTKDGSARALYIKSITVTYTTASCTTLSAPGSPSSTPYETSVDLSWNSVANSSGYLVTFGGTEYNIASGTTTKTITGLKKEKTYAWTVAAKGDGTTYCALGTATSEQSVTTLDGCSDSKVTYTVASTSSVTPSGAPAGTSASYSSTYSSKYQLTSGNSMTLTLTGYAGKKIKGLTLDMRSNGSAGAGTFSMVIGSSTVASISSATAFDEWYDNDSYGTDYRKVHVTLSDEVTVGTGESIVITIAATTNSLYCQGFALCYSSCTPLGTINGSVSLTQGGNSVTISGWSDVSDVGTYTVKMYKKNGASWDPVSGTASGGSAGTAGTRTGITSGSKSVTYTGLEVESEYKFTVQAIAGSAAFCDGEETDVTNINSTDVSSTPFKFRYSICIDDGTGNNWTHHYITPTGNTDEGSVTLTSMPAHVDCYQFKIYGGFSGNWGQTGTGKIEGTTATAWTLNGGNQVYLKTGAAGDYVFTVDYSGTTNPKVSVTYPSADQDEGYVIYYDNSVLNWSNLYYRIGNNSSCSKVDDVALVLGTDKFYKVTTPEFNSMDAWHIANNYGWTGSNSIYRTKTDDSQSDIAITNSINFQQYVVTEDITIIPTTTHSTGGDDQNNNCEFYTINTPTSGMLTHNVAVGTAAHGTVVATYTNTSGTTGQTVAEGANADLAHRCIVTITATADPGYSCTSLTVNGAAFTSGNEHILTADATIAATFTAQTSTVTLDNNDATSGSQQTVSATYDAAMPLVTTAAGTPAVAALSRTGYTFTGWWDATSGGTQYYSYNAGTSTLSSARTWDKTGVQTLKAQWSINSYTLTWNLGGRGKITTAGTAAPENTTGTPHDDIEYNTAISVPVAGSANGYTFTGWSPEPASKMPAENTTYTAQWSANQYTVTLNNHGATTAGTESVTATFDAAMPAITPPEKTGYRFDGYYTLASGGTKYYNADGTSATIMKLYGATPTLHAHWVAQLTFSVNGAIDDELTRDDNTAMPSTAAVPTACGDCWAFMGWGTDPDEDGAPAYAGGATHEFGEPTTLYAVFGKSVFEWITSTSELVANDNYVLTNIADDNEYALSNTANPTYENDAASTDVTDKIKENAEGYYLYNPAPNNIWKFTGTSSSGQLYNAASSKYLNLSGSVSILSTSNNLTFTLGSNGQWTINSTKYLRHYSANDWDVASTLTSGDFSCYLYHQISAEYATVPNCETYDIVWKVNGTPLASGSQTEETNACAGIETLPDDPDDDELDCATKFMGWSEQELVGEGHDAPADLFATVGYAPAIDEDKTFHAVFATTVGTPIAAIKDTEFSSKDENGGYCNATYSFKAVGKYLQKQSIWTSSNMTNVKVRIRVYHVSNSSSDVLRVSLINSSGAEVVGADLTTSKLGNNIESAGGWSDVVELTPTSAVTGYKVSMKTSNSYGTGIDKIEREVIASGIKDYMTTCCNHIVTLSDGSPANGTVTFDPVGPVETCTAAQEVSMTITPNPGYYLSGWTSSGVAPSSVEPAVITNTANAQTTTVTFAKETTEGTYTAGATFSAKALEGWTWMYKKDADAADDAVDPYAIPDVVELYKDQYARFIITGYTPVDVIADKQGYVYNNDSNPKEPQYDRDLLAYVSKNGSAPWQYFQLRGKAPTESTTITFKAVGDASITRTMTICVKALPLAHFVDNVHNESFADVVATVTTGVVTLTKQTPTHADFTGSALNTCEETHVYLIGWIDKDWADEHPNATHSEIIGAGEGVFYAPNADIDLVAKNGKTYLAVWSKIE